MKMTVSLYDNSCQWCWTHLCGKFPFTLTKVRKPSVMDSDWAFLNCCYCFSQFSVMVVVKCCLLPLPAEYCVYLLYRCCVTSVLPGMMTITLNPLRPSSLKSGYFCPWNRHSENDTKVQKYEDRAYIVSCAINQRLTGNSKHETDDITDWRWSMDKYSAYCLALTRLMETVNKQHSHVLTQASR